MRLAMIGPIFVFIFMIMSSAKDVFFSGAFKILPFFTTTFIVFAVCSTSLIFVSTFERQSSLKIVFADRIGLLSTNLFSAIGWISYFAALKFIEPAIAYTLSAGVGTLTISVLSHMRFHVVNLGEINRTEALCQWIIVIVLAYLVAVATSDFSALPNQSNAHRWIGCTFAIISGAAVTISLLFAKRLHEAGASSAAVAGTRLLGTVVLALSAAVHQEFPIADLEQLRSSWTNIVLVSLLLMALPIYFNQIGTRLSTPITVRTMHALGPIILLVMQTAIGGLSLSWFTLMGIVVYGVAAIAAALARGWVAVRANP